MIELLHLEQERDPERDSQRSGRLSYLDAQPMYSRNTGSPLGRVAWLATDLPHGHTAPGLNPRSPFYFESILDRDRWEHHALVEHMYV